MTWWANPTADPAVLRFVDEEGVETVYRVEPAGVAEIPSVYDRPIQWRWTPGSPLIGMGTMLVKVDEATVMAAKAEAEAKVEAEKPAPEPERAPVVEEPRVSTKRK